MDFIGRQNPPSLNGIDGLGKGAKIRMDKEMGGGKGKGRVRTSKSQEVDLACFNTSQREMLTKLIEHGSHYAHHEEETKEKRDKKEKGQSPEQTKRTDMPR